MNDKQVWIDLLKVLFVLVMVAVFIIACALMILNSICGHTHL